MQSSEEEFLKKYDLTKYDRPSVTADTVVFSGDKVLMVKRKNFPDKGKWALPGGFMEKGESAEQTAARELKEETGYSSENLEWILTIRTTVAFCDERIEVFVARNLIPGEQSLDEDEFVDVKAYELDELKQMIFEGKIQDSKTMAAILAYESKYLHG